MSDLICIYDFKSTLYLDNGSLVLSPRNFRDTHIQHPPDYILAKYFQAKRICEEPRVVVNLGDLRMSHFELSG